MTSAVTLWKGPEMLLIKTLLTKLSKLNWSKTQAVVTWIPVSLIPVSAKSRLTCFINRMGFQNFQSHFKLYSLGSCHVTVQMCED